MTLHRAFTQRLPLPLQYLYLKGFSGAFSICWMNPKLGRVLSFSLPAGFFYMLILVFYLSPVSTLLPELEVNCLVLTGGFEYWLSGGWHLGLLAWIPLRRKEQSGQTALFSECVTMRIYSFTIRSMEGREGSSFFLRVNDLSNVWNSHLPLELNSVRYVQCSTGASHGI